MAKQKKFAPTGGEIMSGAGQGAAIGTKILPGWGTAIGAVAGGIGSAMFGGRKETPEEAARREALANYNKIALPDLSQSIPQLQGYTPQEVQDALAEQERANIQSQMSGIQTDPQYAKAQLEALGQLQGLGKSGFDLNDIAGIRRIQEDQAMNQRANREAMLQRMEAKGQGTSGASVAAQMMADQSGANRASQEQLAIAAQRQQAKRDAMLKAGAYAGDIRKQEFGEKENIATAQDLMSRFNEQNSAGRAQRNVEARRAIETARLGEKRTAEASRINTQNEMARERAGLPKAQYDLRTGQIQNRLNLETGGATASAAADAAHNKNVSDTFGGLEGLVTAYTGSKKKEDESGISQGSKSSSPINSAVDVIKMGSY